MSRQGKFRIYVGSMSPQQKKVVRFASPEAWVNPLCDEPFEWRDDVEPCWAGEDTSECVAALNPRSAPPHDLARFLVGARLREEPVIIVVEPAPSIKTIEFTSRAEVDLTPLRFWLSFVGLPTGVRPLVAKGLSHTDKYLALRLASSTPEAWASVEQKGKSAGENPAPLRPLIEDSAGRTLCAT